jgi:hypothetical protein
MRPAAVVPLSPVLLQADVEALLPQEQRSGNRYTYRRQVVLKVAW